MQADSKLATAVKRGMAEGQAMARAHRAGATWVRIAEHFGMRNRPPTTGPRSGPSARTVRAYRPRRR